MKDKKFNEDSISTLKKARERARDGSTYWSENWELAEDDLEFLEGTAQWPEAISAEREKKGRPCLTNNVLPSFVDQVLGDQRQNRPSIKVSAKNVTRVLGADGKSEELKIKSLTGEEEYTLAEVLTGVIRNIEYNSDAETSYDIAFESAVQSGFGFLRVRADWCGDKWEQDLIIDHIENQFSVIIDPFAKERDCSDADWMIVDDTMRKDVFKSMYPNASFDALSSDSGDNYGDWYSEDTVRVSEYFVRECEMKEMALLSDGRSVYMDEIKDVIDELEEQGITITRTRKVKSYKVLWYKITGSEILDGPKELPFKTIPIVPVWGKCIVIKKKKYFRSLIRYSKDSQRMSNYWDSAATEAVALAPKAPFIGTPAQIEGYEDDWENINTENISIARFNREYQGDNGPQRSQPAMIPAAELTLGQSAVDKIKATMGMFDASLGASGPEISGRAIIARQRQGDRGSYTFIDNLSKSIRRVGKLLVEAIPKVYDTERITQIKFQDDTDDYVKLNEQIFDKQTGKWVTINDLSIAEYDIAVTTGPSYSTQRVEAAEAMIQFAQAVPQAAAVMADLIAQNMDWPGSDVIAERLKKIVPPNVLSKKEREVMAADMEDEQPQEPTQEQQMQMQEIEVRKVEADADIQKAQAEVVKAQADVEQSKASVIIAQLKTQEAQSKMQQIEQGAEQGNVSMQMVREMIAEALAEVMSVNQQKMA